MSAFMFFTSLFFFLFYAFQLYRFFLSSSNVFEEKKDGEIGGKTSVPKTDPEIEALKQKALFLQFLLEEK